MCTVVHPLIVLRLLEHRLFTPLLRKTNKALNTVNTTKQAINNPITKKISSSSSFPVNNNCCNVNLNSTTSNSTQQSTIVTDNSDKTSSLLNNNNSLLSKKLSLRKSSEGNAPIIFNPKTNWMTKYNNIQSKDNSLFSHKFLKRIDYNLNTIESSTNTINTQSNVGSSNCFNELSHTSPTISIGNLQSNEITTDLIKKSASVVPTATSGRTTPSSAAATAATTPVSEKDILFFKKSMSNYTVNTNEYKTANSNKKRISTGSIATNSISTQLNTNSLSPASSITFNNTNNNNVDVIQSECYSETTDGANSVTTPPKRYKIPSSSTNIFDFGKKILKRVNSGNQGSYLKNRGAKNSNTINKIRQVNPVLATSLNNLNLIHSNYNDNTAVNNKEGENNKENFISNDIKEFEKKLINLPTFTLSNEQAASNLMPISSSVQLFVLNNNENNDKQQSQIVVNSTDDKQNVHKQQHEPKFSLYPKIVIDSDNTGGNNHTTACTIDEINDKNYSKFKRNSHSLNCLFELLNNNDYSVDSKQSQINENNNNFVYGDQILNKKHLTNKTLKLIKLSIENLLSTSNNSDYHHHATSEQQKQVNQKSYLQRLKKSFKNYRSTSQSKSTSNMDTNKKQQSSQQQHSRLNNNNSSSNSSNSGNNSDRGRSNSPYLNQNSKSNQLISESDVVNNTAIIGNINPVNSPTSNTLVIANSKYDVMSLQSMESSNSTLSFGLLVSQKLCSPLSSCQFDEQINKQKVHLNQHNTELDVLNERKFSDSSVMAVEGLERKDEICLDKQVISSLNDMNHKPGSEVLALISMWIKNAPNDFLGN